MSSPLPGELLESKVLLHSCKPTGCVAITQALVLCFSIMACGMVGALDRKPQ